MLSAEPAPEELPDCWITTVAFATECAPLASVTARDTVSLHREHVEL